MARGFRAISSVYFPSVINQFMFGQLVVMYFIMQLLLQKSSKTNLIFFQARKSEFRNLVYFVNSYRNHSADGIFIIAATSTLQNILTSTRNASANMLHNLVNEYCARETAIILIFGFHLTLLQAKIRFMRQYTKTCVGPLFF